MTLLKPLQTHCLLTKYEQFYIQFFHKNGKFISEQSPGNPNPLFDLTIHPHQHRANELRFIQLKHYLLTGSDSLLQLRVCTSSAYRLNHTHTQQLKPPPTAPHAITTKTNEHIIPHTINIPEFNTAYCYSTIPRTAITPLSRQLLMMCMCTHCSVTGYIKG